MGVRPQPGHRAELVVVHDDPAGAGASAPTVAVGSEAGVVIFDLETGRRTRVFAGHSGPVVSVVPSPDGRWLATSSLDQTILLYPLAGVRHRGRGWGRRFAGGRTVPWRSPGSSPAASPPGWDSHRAT